MTQIEWLKSQDALEEFCAHAQTKEHITFDTEFHREKTFFAELALIQIGTDERIACVDPLAPLDLAPLYALLTHSQILKVVHAGRQDIEILYDRLGAVIGPIFDTQVAAALLGYGDQIGYGALVKSICNITLSKKFARTNWLKRPLDTEVIEYAANDVTHLRDVYRTLNQKLESLERRAWLDEEQKVLLAESTYAPDKNELWRSVKGASRLKGVDCALLQSLAAYRDDNARRANLPKKRVLSDDVMLDLVKQKPQTQKALERMRGLDAGVVRRKGNEIMGLISKALKLPKDKWPSPFKRKPEEVDDALLDVLNALVRICAKENNISARLLATRKSLEQAVRKQEGMLFEGWRNEIVGTRVKAFLSGEISMRCGPNSRLTLSS